MSNFVSVIVCTHNRQDYIGKCLEHLHHQTATKETYEVIVVDNSSTDRTQQVCNKIISQYPGTRFRYIVEPTLGLSHARNRGVKEAQGNIIAFLDDDAFAHEDFIEKTATFFNQHDDVLATGGRIVPHYEEQEPSWMTPYLMPLVAAQDLGNMVIPFRSGKFPIGANMAFRKKAFTSYGNFNTELGRKGTLLEGGEEKDFFQRLRKAGEKVMYVPSIRVRHVIPASRTNPAHIERQAIGIGRSERLRIQKNESNGMLSKVVQEITKSLGSIVLFFGYLLTGRPAKGWMLIKFRYWVVKGLFST